MHPISVAGFFLGPSSVARTRRLRRPIAWGLGRNSSPGLRGISASMSRVGVDRCEAQEYQDRCLLVTQSNAAERSSQDSLRSEPRKVTADQAAEMSLFGVREGSSTQRKGISQGGK
ncbi:uncharacterized protein LAESUDRAFT_72073 [Laetiporus sulphureus 93-53]|uniref:Uncharacterized protein n=1 Tax=Laetiporus sulphureus 93-53 TaxID=1314785 RepID=A0A165AVW6_9APHY|nr:uncharacterized protein LAESUDRAFT_72073 [Laetiporus sulphureus 93-53]KZS99764.1 hypothetical protein LAESUDRAFT_72073 [Laetiporus sulphureus 93-53]